MFIVHIIEWSYTQKLEKIITWVHKGKIKKRWALKAKHVGLFEV
jgi:hypothetical protein